MQAQEYVRRKFKSTIKPNFWHCYKANRAWRGLCTLGNNLLPLIHTQIYQFICIDTKSGIYYLLETYFIIASQILKFT